MATKFSTFIEPQEGARSPDSRLDLVPAYAFQGEKISCVPELIKNIKVMFLKPGTRVERIFLTLEAYDMWSRGSHELFKQAAKTETGVLIECEEVVRSSPTDVV